MNGERRSFHAAVVQAGSVVFDREGSARKAATLIRQAGGEGARLVLLPEAFIPGYPRGLCFGMTVGSRSQEGRDLWKIYWENAVDVPGPTTDLLAEAARDAGVLTAVGVVERDLTD